MPRRSSETAADVRLDKNENDIRMENITWNGLMLREALPSEREELLSQRFKICSVTYDFRKDTMSREKEAKRQALVELIDYVNNTKHGFNEIAMKEARDMVAANIFRSLEIKERNPLELMDLDDEEPTQDIAWPHLQLVYEFLLRFVSSKDIDSKLAQRFLNQAFIEGVLGLLDSDDIREREVIKAIMQKYWNRFTTMRSMVRKALQHACLRAAYESEMPTGIAELLELMVKVINGFTVPLKNDGKQLLTRVLLPLHKVQLLFTFQDQLTRCLMLFIEKDPKLCHIIISALLAAWPCTNGPKQILFIEEVEDLLKLLPASDFPRILPGFVHRLTLCITCPNAQVAERALQLWNASSFTKLINGHRQATFPPIISALYRNATQHWSGSVHGRTFDVLRLLMEADENTFSESSARHRRISEEIEDRDELRERKWAALRKQYDLKEKERHAIAARKAKQEKAQAPKKQTNASVFSSQPSAERQIRQDVNILSGVNYGLCVSGQLTSDVQALVIDVKGDVVNLVSAHNYTALNAAVVHTGALRASRSNGKAHEIAIWVSLSRFPANIRQVFFLLIPTQAMVNDSKSPRMCMARFTDASANENVVDFSVESDPSGIVVVAALERDQDYSWSFARICLPAQANRLGSITQPSAHYVSDAFDRIGNLVRDKIASAGRPLRVCLDLEKGSVIDLVPLLPSRFFLCAGWDLKDEGYLNERTVDVDVSAVLFGVTGNELGVVSANSPDVFGVCHSGSGLLSASVAVTLKEITEQVSQLFLVAHVRTSSVTYDSIQHPTCRVMDDRGACLMHFSVKEHARKAGLIFGRLHIEPESRIWRFQAMGTYCDGHSYNDPETSRTLQVLYQKSILEFQRQPDSLKSCASATNGCLSESL